MADTGRPRLMADPAKRKAVCTLISVGTGYDEAARHVGCTARTIRREAERDEAFAKQLREAETAVELHPLSSMRKAAGDNWRAAAWLLERLYPERFARRKPETVLPNEMRAVFDDVASIFADLCTDDDQLAEMCERLDYVQKEHFGEFRSGVQGDPAPKSADQRFYDRVKRETSENANALLARMDEFNASGWQRR